MPQILPSHAPSPKAALGWDGTQYRVLAVDDEGRLQADLVASALPEKTGRMYRVQHKKVGAGNYAMVGHTVAPGTVFVMTLLAAYNEYGTIGKLYDGVWDTSDNSWFNYDVTLVQFEVLSWAGQAFLPAGYEPKVYFDTVANGDDLVMVYSGYTLVL